MLLYFKVNVYYYFFKENFLFKIYSFHLAKYFYNKTISMKKTVFFLLSNLYCFILFAQNSKAPAYPLITHDPYFSIWSNSDELMKSQTKHWTGVDHSLIGMIQVDNQTYRFLGDESPRFETILPANDVLNFDANYTETEPSADWIS